jgi:hypothetical protein
MPAGVWTRYSLDYNMWCAAAGKDTKGGNLVWVGGEKSWVLALDDAGKSHWGQVQDGAGKGHLPYWNDVTAAGERQTSNANCCD